MFPPGTGHAEAAVILQEELEKHIKHQQEAAKIPDPFAGIKIDWARADMMWKAAQPGVWFIKEE